MSEEKGRYINWKTVALIGTPIAVAGIAGYLIYRCSKTSAQIQKTSVDTVEVDALESADPLVRANAFKDLGNRNFRAQRYDRAIDFYKKAIEACPPEMHDELSIYYQNRSAALFSVSKFDEALEDCNSALQHKPRYVKALSRRGRIYEDRNMYRQALQDSTAVCLFEGFNNEENVMRAERTMKCLGDQLFQEMQKLESTRSDIPRIILPNVQYIKDMIKSFECDPLIMEGRKLAEIVNGIHSELGSTHVGVLHEALKALYQEKFDDCAKLAFQTVDLLEENNGSLIEECFAPSISMDATDGDGGANVGADLRDVLLAYLLRGSLYFIAFKADKAQNDFNKVLSLASRSEDGSRYKDILVNAHIKLALTDQELGGQPNLSRCAESFERAFQMDSTCVDIYSHRGQFRLISSSGAAGAGMSDEMGFGNVAVPNTAAISDDFRRAIELSPDNPLHKAYLFYAKIMAAIQRMDLASVNREMDQWDKLIDKYPKICDIQSLQGQILMELGRFPESINRFEQALQNNSTSPGSYVHLAMAKLREEAAKAANSMGGPTSINSVSDSVLQLLRRAVEIEPRSVTAHETLATVLNQIGDLDGALRHYEAASRLPNSPKEISNYLALRESVRAQLDMMVQYGIDMQEMRALRESAMTGMLRRSAAAAAAASGSSSGSGLAPPGFMMNQVGDY